MTENQSPNKLNEFSKDGKLSPQEIKVLDELIRDANSQETQKGKESTIDASKKEMAQKIMQHLNNDAGEIYAKQILDSLKNESLHPDELQAFKRIVNHLGANKPIANQCRDEINSLEREINSLAVANMLKQTLKEHIKEEHLKIFDEPQFMQTALYNVILQIQHKDIQLANFGEKMFSMPTEWKEIFAAHMANILVGGNQYVGDQNKVTNNARDRAGLVAKYQNMIFKSLFKNQELPQHRFEFVMRKTGDGPGKSSTDWLVEKHGEVPDGRGGKKYRTEGAFDYAYRVENGETKYNTSSTRIGWRENQTEMQIATMVSGNDGGGGKVTLFIDGTKIQGEIGDANIIRWKTEPKDIPSCASFENGAWKIVCKKDDLKPKPRVVLMVESNKISNGNGYDELAFTIGTNGNMENPTFSGAEAQGLALFGSAKYIMERDNNNVLLNTALKAELNRIDMKLSALVRNKNPDAKLPITLTAGTDTDSLSNDKAAEIKNGMHDFYNKLMKNISEKIQLSKPKNSTPENIAQSIQSVLDAFGLKSNFEDWVPTVTLHETMQKDTNNAILARARLLSLMTELVAICDGNELGRIQLTIDPLKKMKGDEARNAGIKEMGPQHSE